MAITVNESYEDRSTRIGLYLKRDHNRRFIAVTSAGEGSWTVARATGVPSLGDAHPEDSIALCTDIDAKVVGSEPNVWTVSCKYTNDLPEDSIDDDDPTSQRPDQSWGSDDFSRFVSEDRDGNAILNTAGDRYEEPIEVVDSFPVLTVTRNRNSFNVATAYAYNNSVNSDTYRGAAPGTLRVKITATERWKGDAPYWETSYVFRYNPHGWQPKVLESGLYQMWNSNKLPCTEKGAEAYDSDPVTHPVPLDVNGRQIDPANLPGNAYYTTWNTLPELSYAALGV